MANWRIFASAAAIMACTTILSARPEVAPRAPDPDVAAVLERAAAYAADFHRRLSSIVAEERYSQRWQTVGHGRYKGTIDLGHRELRSDLLLLKPLDADDWLQYRDVYHVDGTPIRDRDERLARLFREGSASSEARMGTILQESARYNIGDIQRNV